MSKGNEVFYYGDIEQPTEYNKSQIQQFTVIKVSSSRNPISGFALVVIELKNGHRLQIPNLLVDDIAMKQKLKGIPNVKENRAPFVK